MRRGKAALVGLSSAALALLLAGCFSFQAPPTAQQVKKTPRVKVTMKICEPDAAEPTVCPNLGAWGSDESDGEQARVLVGLRVPNGTTAPPAFNQAGGDLLGDGVRFERFAAYTRELNQKAPKPTGFRWFGYISSANSAPFKGDHAVGLRGRYVVGLRAPKRLLGKRFRVRPVVGGTLQAGIDDEWQCGDDPFSSHNNGGFTDTQCINDPAKGQLRPIVVRMKKP